jgi:hypothetical protein
MKIFLNFYLLICIAAVNTHAQNILPTTGNCGINSSIPPDAKLLINSDYNQMAGCGI